MKKNSIKEIEVKNMYIFYDNVVTRIDQDHAQYEELSHAIMEFIKDPSSCTDTLDQTFLFQGYGKANISQLNDNWLEIHFNPSIDTNFAKNKHTGIKTLLFTLREGYLYLYEDECLNEAPSLVAYICNETAILKLAKIIKKVNL